MFDTDLSAEYALAEKLGVSPQAAYHAGHTGALCDETTRSRLIASNADQPRELHRSPEPVCPHPAHSAADASKPTRVAG
jgi:hypothetical protein